MHMSDNIIFWRNKCRVALLFSGLGLFAFAGPVSSTTNRDVTSLTAMEIMRKNVDAEFAHDEKSQVKITMKNAQGKTQERTLTWETVTLKDGTKKSMVYFSRPKSIKGTALLTIENKVTDDERWLYLPALKKTRRISGSEKADNFMGTDFSYEDLVTEELNDHSYTLDEEASCKVPCLVVVATPSNERQKIESGYSRRVITLNPETFMIYAVDYFNKSGRLSKSYKAEDFRPVNGGNSVRPFRTEMVDHINGHLTVMQFDSYVINAGIDEHAISLRALTSRQ